jgi:nitrogen fixation NifU-like protein
MSMYSPQLLDHFEHPRNTGELVDADAHVRVENPACGDILELSARVRAGKIVEIQFKAKGCVPAMACGSLIAEMAKAKSLAELATIGREQVVERIGGLPAASGHAAQLAVDALGALIRQLAAIRQPRH